MDQMFRRFSHPYFRFPGDHPNIFLRPCTVWKSGYVNQTCRTSGKQPLHGLYPCLVEGAVPTHRLNQIKPILLREVVIGRLKLIKSGGIDLTTSGDNRSLTYDF